MFKLSTKGKGKKVGGKYFHYFKQPTFENAKDIGEDKLLYNKEGNDDVLYVYDWDKTNDNFVLQKELSKVLVSQEELIRNILNK